MANIQATMMAISRRDRYYKVVLLLHTYPRHVSAHWLSQWTWWRVQKRPGANSKAIPTSGSFSLVVKLWALYLATSVSVYSSSTPLLRTAPTICTRSHGGHSQLYVTQSSPASCHSITVDARLCVIVSWLYAWRKHSVSLADVQNGNHQHQ